MNDIAEQQEEKPKRRGRGKGTRPALAHVNVRIPIWVLDYYRQQQNYTKAMREVLTMHVLDNQVDQPQGEVK